MDETILLLKIRQKDKASFDILFRAYYKPLCLFAYKILRESDLAEEVVQEFFISIWEKTPVINGSVKSYFYKSIYNRCLNVLEKLKNRKKNEDAFSNIKEESVPENNDEYQLSPQIIDAAIQELPVKCREIFILCKYNEMTYGQVAELLNISPKTIENQMGIALKKLREKLLPYFFKK